MIHFSHTCTLQIEGKAYPVVDLQEGVKAAQTLHEANQIVVMDAMLRPVKQTEYTRERPLFCSRNQLFVFGDLAINNTLPEGNVLTFTNGGQDIQISRVDVINYPLKPFGHKDIK